MAESDPTSSSKTPAGGEPDSTRRPGFPGFQRRVLVLLVLVGLAFGCMVSRLVWMQVVSGDEYTEKARQQRRYIKILDAPPGSIVTSDGSVAATTEGTFNVAAFLPDLDARFAAIDILVWYARPNRRTLLKRMLELGDAVATSADPGTARLFALRLTPKCVKLIRKAAEDDSDLSASIIFRKNPADRELFDLYLDYDRLMAKSFRTIEALAAFLGVDPAPLHRKADDTARKIFRLTNSFEYRARRETPVTLVKSVPERTAFELGVRAAEFPGIEIQTDQRRYYPGGQFACHVIGYAGVLSPPEFKKLKAGGRIVWRGPKRFSVLDAMREGSVFFANEAVGRSGIERSFEGILAGMKGVAISERLATQASPVVHEMIAPVEGVDVHLTIDSEMQRIAEQVFAEGEGGEPLAGAAVVLNVNTGAVLVMVSAPGFDLNSFRNPREYEKLKEKPSPFMNRAISAPVPPGSVFKILIALGALEENAISDRTHIRCRGYLHNPDAFRCRNHAAWLPPFGVSEALCRSCNVFFYTAGERMNAGGGVRLQEWARMSGFGRPTGIDLPGEKGGTVPDLGWKKKRLERAKSRLAELRAKEKKLKRRFRKAHEEYTRLCNAEPETKESVSQIRKVENKLREFDRELQKLYARIESAEKRLDWAQKDSFWTKGNDRLLGIGQGGVLVTPLQIARFAAAIANGGKFYRPHLLAADGRNYLDWRIDFSPSALAAVRRGMVMVVHDSRGTAHHRRDENGNRIPSALSMLPVAAKTGTAETNRVKGLNQAWIAGYGPIGNPEIAFAVTVENTKGHGGSVCGPMAAQILAAYFSRREGP
ncbi:MAG: hypothetical protein E3J72_05270 [Planctomycetota bacterium]|nr:MAG: hypothetical protein E3J72_05270 [Planctomycetota bacterium]